MPSRHFDSVIIGQGLAGSALAWHLVEAGQRVLVVDDGHRSSSSQVAAGLINPLGGMRFNRLPQVRDWLEAAERWYALLAERFGQPFLHGLPMLRLLRSSEQRRFHARRLADPLSRDLVGELFPADACPEPIVADHGGFLQARTGYVDLPLLLGTLGNWLDAAGAMRKACVDHGEVVAAPRHVRVGDITADRLVFCDGARMRHNPWFDWLPLAPEKGEIIDVAISDWQPAHIINGSHWLVPLHGGGLRFGATHEHHCIDGTPTTQGRRELLDALHALRPHDDPRIERHVAGIRPATVDRYPLIGRHPEIDALWVFNGFGARGALSIPWYAARMADHLVEGRPLPGEADIRRLCANR